MNNAMKLSTYIALALFIGALSLFLYLFEKTLLLSQETDFKTWASQAISTQLPTPQKKGETAHGK